MNDNLVPVDYAEKPVKLPKDMTGEEVWQQYGRWIIKFSNRYLRKYAHFNIDRWDLYGRAFEAFVYSASRWDPMQKAGILTYSGNLMARELNRYIVHTYIRGLAKEYQKDGQKCLPTILSSDRAEGVDIDDEARGAPDWAIGPVAGRKTYNRAVNEMLQERGSISEFTASPEKLANRYRSVQAVRAVLHRGKRGYEGDMVLTRDETILTASKVAGTSRGNIYQQLEVAVEKVKGPGALKRIPTRRGQRLSKRKAVA